VFAKREIKRGEGHGLENLILENSRPSGVQCSLRDRGFGYGGRRRLIREGKGKKKKGRENSRSERSSISETAYLCSLISLDIRGDPGLGKGRKNHPIARA